MFKQEHSHNEARATPIASAPPEFAGMPWASLIGQTLICGKFDVRAEHPDKSHALTVPLLSLNSVVGNIVGSMYYH